MLYATIVNNKLCQKNISIKSQDMHQDERKQHHKENSSQNDGIRQLHETVKNKYTWKFRELSYKR